MINTEIFLTLLRILIGALFIGHGAQKLFGWFGGPGMEGHTGFMRSLGLQPASLWAWFSALGEFVGGLLLVLGLLTPVGAAAIIASMLMAIIKVHWQNGLWNTEGGFEFNLVLIANALLIGFAGPGLYALDNAINLPWSQPALFIISLVAAIIGVAVALLTTQTQEPEQERTRTPQSG